MKIKTCVGNMCIEFQLCKDVTLKIEKQVSVFDDTYQHITM
jgi:hypothetical protein